MAQARLAQERIRELFAPFLAPESLSENQLQSIFTYLDLLMKWNSKINLTAVRSPEEIVTRHFGESLFAARHLFPAPLSGGTAIDLGSGAGFPGLPFKIWTPALELTLLESNNKKVAFLREVVRSLNLSVVRVLAHRAEDVEDKAELVSLRAVERFEQALPIARRLVKPGARLALLIGAGQFEQGKSLLPDIQWEDPVPIPLSRSRVLAIGHSQ